MPVYQCVVPAGALDPDQRTRVAETITTIHCEVTGAPPEFVNVVFTEPPAGAMFTAGKPSRTAIVAGNIRAGRPPEARRALLDRISDAWVEITGWGKQELVVSVADVPASWVMEKGMIMPEPGEEEAWLRRLQEQQAGST
jgi:phenylpyruvate tautomerase PptA (4-oxalocrotonate tautomerase family)